MGDNNPKDFLNGIDDTDFLNLENIYRSGMLQQSLRLTRDTLRHYESLGLISPELNKDNRYREYSFSDVLALLTIDNYKKHGLSLKNIHSILEGASLQELQTMFEEQEEKLREELCQKQLVLKHLHSMKSFLSKLDMLETFSIQKFPCYEVLGELSAFSSIEEYSGQLSDIPSNDALLSHLIRVVTFNETQYLDSKMVVVSQTMKKETGKHYLESTDCMYGIVSSKHHIDNNSTLFGELYEQSYKWAKEHNVNFQGVVYIRPKVLLFGEKNEQVFLEFWVPLQDE